MNVVVFYMLHKMRQKALMNWGVGSFLSYAMMIRMPWITVGRKGLLYVLFVIPGFYNGHTVIMYIIKLYSNGFIIHISSPSLLGFPSPCIYEVPKPILFEVLTRLDQYRLLWFCSNWRPRGFLWSQMRLIQRFLLWAKIEASVLYNLLCLIYRVLIHIKSQKFLTLPKKSPGELSSTPSIAQKHARPLL